MRGTPGLDSTHKGIGAVGKYAPIVLAGGMLLAAALARHQLAVARRARARVAVDLEIEQAMVVIRSQGSDFDWSALITVIGTIVATVVNIVPGVGQAVSAAVAGATAAGAAAAGAAQGDRAAQIAAAERDLRERGDRIVAAVS